MHFVHAIIEIVKYKELCQKYVIMPAELYLVTVLWSNSTYAYMYTHT